MFASVPTVVQNVKQSCPSVQFEISHLLNLSQRPEASGEDLESSCWVTVAIAVSIITVITRGDEYFITTFAKLVKTHAHLLLSFI